MLRCGPDRLEAGASSRWEEGNKDDSRRGRDRWDGEMNGAEMLCGVESDCLMTWGNGILMRGVRGSKYEVEEADSCLYSLTDFSWPQGYVSCDFPRI